MLRKITTILVLSFVLYFVLFVAEKKRDPPKKDDYQPMKLEKPPFIKK